MKKEEILKLLESKIHYPVSMEVSGSYAMFARPDTGSEKTSYPTPTFSAAKGIFESILYMPSAIVIPVKVQICSPIRYESYAFNYRGELRKSNLIKEDNTCQIKTTVLMNPCYRIFAEVINNDEYELPEIHKKYKKVNHAHSYQVQFNRRLLKGKNYRRPCLGLSEYLVSYVGKFRDETKVQENINFTMSSMLLCCFDSLNKGEYSPSSIQNVEIINGELYYVK